MSPSFLEAAELERLAATLRRSPCPSVWRRETAQAVARLRPEVLILSEAATGLRAAWALAQVSGPARLVRLRWDDRGRPCARLSDLGTMLRFEVRELQAGMGGGLTGVLQRALRAPPATPGLIVFLSSGWGGPNLRRALSDTAMRARAARWRRCYLLANGACFGLHPTTRRLA